jgi:hypothetical protein
METVHRRPVRIDEDYDAIEDAPAATANGAGTDEVPVPRAQRRPQPGPGRVEALPAEPVQYPIPPAFADGPAGARPGPVPTWAVRARSPSPRPLDARGSAGELTLDPMSLRRRVTIRSGPSSLSADEAKLVLRSWWRRTEIPWAEIDGFEPRFDAVNASGGRLVALTSAGPRELPATKRPAADLRNLAALLEAYRQRALIFTYR